MLTAGILVEAGGFLCADCFVLAICALFGD